MEAPPAALTAKAFEATEEETFASRPFGPYRIALSDAHSYTRANAIPHALDEGSFGRRRALLAR